MCSSLWAHQPFLFFDYSGSAQLAHAAQPAPAGHVRNPYLRVQFRNLFVALTFSSVRGSKATRMGATAIVFISLVDASGFCYPSGERDGHILWTTSSQLSLGHNVCGKISKHPSFLIAGVIGGLGRVPSRPCNLYSCGPSSCLFDVNAERRRMAGYYAGRNGDYSTAQMIGAAWYFGSPVPLSFYAKVLRLYPGLRTFRFMNEYQLFDFIRAYRVLFW